MLQSKQKKKQEGKRTIPKSVQRSIPINHIFKDGIIKCGRRYSKSWRFSDVNYAVASDDDQLEMFLAHSAILNGLPTDAVAQISIYTRQHNQNVFEEMIGADYGDFAVYKEELKELLADKMSESNNIVHEKYITVSTEQKNIEEARTLFTRVGSDLTTDFARITSKMTELDYFERLRIFYDVFRGNTDEVFQFDLKSEMARGTHFVDSICPDSLEFKSDYIKIGDRYARVLFLREYPSFLKDSIISELTDFSRSMMVSVDIQPIPTDEAAREVQKKLLAIETDITKWQQK
ncbi:MAG: TraE family protein, partial [Clostridiaceae bacterium]|nr:TraE family protein [Clostridiaceae bacterium]